MPDLSFERSLQERGFRVIAGIDEAGRGPLAGPVVAAAVILPGDFADSGVNDSKRLSEKKRDLLYRKITTDPDICWATAEVDAQEIDRLNILRATHMAMRNAADALTRRPNAVLIDGLPVAQFPLPQEAVVKGDSKSLSVAAASILAKVSRDRLMRDYAGRYPGYGFEKHKGYGTKEHLANLARLGPCPIHRRSFRPVAECSYQPKTCRC